MASHIYLAKTGTDLVCHCECVEALMTFPGQLNCAWCGCGWLFSCIECRKAFTFARGVSVQEPWEELARRDLTHWGREHILQEDIDSWVSAMKELLVDVKVGTTYVWLDGVILPADAAAARFEGRRARHDLDFVPQVAALEDRSVIDDLLSNTGYWHANANAQVRRRSLATDFGSCVGIYRADGQQLHPADEARIRNAARALQSAGTDRSSPFAALELGVGSCSDDDGTDGVDLRLTSYFLGDDDNAAEEDAITARDEAVARQFAEHLGQALGAGYRVEPYSGRW